MTTSRTDCRSEEGVTVGLIDSIISICRVLAIRDLSGHETLEALKDLHADKDVLRVVRGLRGTIYDSGHSRAKCSACGHMMPFERMGKGHPFPHATDCPMLITGQL